MNRKGKRKRKIEALRAVTPRGVVLRQHADKYGVCVSSLVKDMIFSITGGIYVPMVLVAIGTTL